MELIEQIQKQELHIDQLEKNELERQLVQECNEEEPKELEEFEDGPDAQAKSMTSFPRKPTLNTNGNIRLLMQKLFQHQSKFSNSEMGEIITKFHESKIERYKQQIEAY